MIGTTVILLLLVAPFVVLLVNFGWLTWQLLEEKEEEHVQNS